MNIISESINSLIHTSPIVSRSIYECNIILPISASNTYVLHAVSCIEYNRGQNYIEEHLWVESSLHNRWYTNVCCMYQQQQTIKKLL
jgi:hypothetical protein